MNMNDYLVSLPKLKQNSARAAIERQAQNGGHFSGLVSALLSPRAERIDAQNNAALQAYEQEKEAAKTRMNWDREDLLAGQTRENKMADLLARYGREDEVARRNRDWQKEDRASDFNNQKALLEKRLFAQGSGGELSPFEKALQAQQGKSAAQNKEEFENQEQLFNSSKELTEQLRALAGKATYHPLGRAVDAVAYLFGSPTEGAIAREKYKQTVANEILPKMKQYLGGQFTEKEGERLKATLGDVNATPAEKEAAIDAFFDARKRAYLEAKNKAAPTAPQGQNRLAAPNTDDPVGIL